MAIDGREMIVAMDQPSIKHRSTLKHHYTMTSNVLIFGYRQLTDPVKLTYQAVDSFDWSNGEGKRKGYAFPSLATLAELRGVDARTLRRHLAALEEAGLLRREVRAGQPSLLWIEEPSKEECERYLSTMTMSPDTDVRGGEDTDVRPLYEESDESEKDKTVNAAKAFKGRRGGKRTLSALEKAKQEWLAKHMVEQLGDAHSLNFYRKVAATITERRVFEVLSEVRNTKREGRVSNAPALFTTLVQLKGGETRRNYTP